MKFNVENPAIGCQKKLEIDDDAKLRAFWDKRISQEVLGDALGKEFKGHVFKITGGCESAGPSRTQTTTGNQKKNKKKK